MSNGCLIMISTNDKQEEETMTQKRYYYFAYGSNMWWSRMHLRCPEALVSGTAILDGYRVVERLYADIERCKKSQVHGVLYTVTKNDLAKLDLYEGVNTKVYKRMFVSVKTEDGKRKAITYVMTDSTKQERNGKSYPAWYRNICSIGARWYGIQDDFSIPCQEGWGLLTPINDTLEELDNEE